MELLCHRPSREPDPYFELLRTSAVREGRLCVVNAIIMDERSRVLILRRAPWKSFLPSCWDLPGGHVERGETLEEALRRETMEETGIALSGIEALTAIWDWEATSGGHMQSVRQFEFKATPARTRQQVRIAPEDFVEYRWITTEELGLLTENRSAGDTGMLEVIGHTMTLQRDHR